MRHFEEELAELKSKLLEMSGLVESAIFRSVTALTTLDRELDKLKKDVPIYLYGGKPKHLKTIKQQLRALKRKRLHMLVQGKTYKF